MSEIKYTRDHESVKIDGDIVTIGITDYAKDALGDLVFIQLPEKGMKITKGKDFAVVESVKIASEIYSPVAGEVVEVNTALGNNVDQLKEPLENGWIARIKVADTGELSGLMSLDEYNTYLKTLG